MNDHISPDDYLDERLPSVDKPAAERHLAACAACRDALAETRTLRAWMKEAPALTPPESFYTNVLRRAKEQPRRSWRFFALPGLAAAAAAVLVLVVVRDAPREKRHYAISYSEETNRLRSVAGADQRRGPSGSERKSRLPGAPAKGEADALKDESAGTAVGGEAEKELRQYARTSRTAPADPSPAVTVVPGGAKTDGRTPALLKEKPAMKRDAGIQEGRISPDEQPSVGKKRAPPPEESARSQSAGWDQSPPALVAAAREGNGKNVAADEWKGFYSAIRAPETLVIRDRKSWDAFLLRHQGSPARNLQSGFPPAPPAAPDFTRLQAVAVFAGEKNTGGHTIDILRVEESTGKIKVIYRETPPPADAMTVQSLTQPFHIKFLPKDPRPVEFQKIP